MKKEDFRYKKEKENILAIKMLLIQAGDIFTRHSYSNYDLIDEEFWCQEMEYVISLWSGEIRFMKSKPYAYSTLSIEQFILEAPIEIKNLILYNLDLFF